MRKHHILYIVIINILSLVCINNISALNYESSVGIGFIFNPTLSVSLSSNDLIIPNLTPGSSSDSNSINVSVTTNASYGYTLSVSSSSDNLIHSNNTNTFSGIATDANLASLTTDNTWGYSTSLDNGSSWSNYNGLSSSTSTTLIDNNNTADSTSNIDFKIGAKAGSTQASGIYTNTINFIAVSKVAPMSLLDSFIASGAEQLNGYYKMQDMTHDICNNVDDALIPSELQLIDARDNKIYWVAKLADKKCWMTQNLELDLIADSAILNSTNTDIDVDSYNPTTGAYSPEGGYSKDENTNIVTWSPIRSTITSLDNNNFPNTTEANNVPYSYNPGDQYYYPNYNSGNDFSYTLIQCENQGHTDCKHYNAGNYYNWSATVASNNTGTLTEQNIDANNSICPKSWRLPKKTANEYQNLVSAYGLTVSNSLNLRKPPLYFVQSGYVNGGSLRNAASNGLNWSSTVYSSSGAYALGFFNGNLLPAGNGSRHFGFPVRCLAE